MGVLSVCDGMLHVQGFDRTDFQMILDELSQN